MENTVGGAGHMNDLIIAGPESTSSVDHDHRQMCWGLQEYCTQENSYNMTASNNMFLGIGGKQYNSMNQIDQLQFGASTSSWSGSESDQSRASNRNISRKAPPVQRSNMTAVERGTEITFSELSQYFHMPITQAARELKVGLTVLKKRCREFGIPRWPHRKMKSLESLIHNIQELGKSNGGLSQARLTNAVQILEEQKRLMEEMPGTELAERTKRLRQACFKANYKKRRQMIMGGSSGSGATQSSTNNSVMTNTAITATANNSKQIIVPNPPQPTACSSNSGCSSSISS